MPPSHPSRPDSQGQVSTSDGPPNTSSSSTRIAFCSRRTVEFYRLVPGWVAISTALNAGQSVSVVMEEVVPSSSAFRTVGVPAASFPPRLRPAAAFTFFFWNSIAFPACSQKAKELAAITPVRAARISTSQIQIRDQQKITEEISEPARLLQ
ncbi:hypothetical protein B0H19DRAFT_1258478 [Mycena capillaripes]|nr:hypothetical protein B0H19DRAFT_1258478 [Mycena capillaripes]